MRQKTCIEKSIGFHGIMLQSRFLPIRNESSMYDDGKPVRSWTGEPASYIRGDRIEKYDRSARES